MTANRLTGTLPPCFPSSNLTELYVSLNQLAGPLPDAFSSSNLIVFYASNQTGPSLDGGPGWAWLGPDCPPPRPTCL
jgi:hypothetical protein